MTKPKFQCPANMQRHAARVFSGEYLVPQYVPTDGAVMLDVGSNVGSFAWWAHAKWPSVKIHCYEPNPATASTLRQNVGDWATIHPVAVFTDGKAPLFFGRHHLGACSLWQGHEQIDSCVEVDCISPTRLPPAEFIKCDCEGAEVAVIAAYPHMDGVKALAVEVHTAKDKAVIAVLMEAYGFELVAESEATGYRGLMKWRRKA